MARQFAWVVLAAFVAAPSLGAGRLSEPQAERTGSEKQSREGRSQNPTRIKWWIDPEHRKELGITDAQSAQIDEIYETTMPAQRAKWHEREKLEQAVSKMLKDHAADVATVTRQVERVEKLGAELRTTRTLMLYRIGLVLTPEQRVKLEAFHKRRDENRRKSDR